jgi:hypothetical protein
MNMADGVSAPEQYIGEPIEVQFDSPPILEKKPGCPNGFIWEGMSFRVIEVLNEWHDYGLRGKSEAFYTKEQGSFRAKAAKRTGTWGVGRDFFRVRVDGGRLFDLYYDRAPKGSKRRKGEWFLFQELSS